MIADTLKELLRPIRSFDKKNSQIDRRAYGKDCKITKSNGLQDFKTIIFVLVHGLSEYGHSQSRVKAYASYLLSYTPVTWNLEMAYQFSEKPILVGGVWSPISKNMRSCHIGNHANPNFLSKKSPLSTPPFAILRKPGVSPIRMSRITKIFEIT